MDTLPTPFAKDKSYVKVTEITWKMMTAYLLSAKFCLYAHRCTAHTNTHSYTYIFGIHHLLGRFFGSDVHLK